MTNTPEFYIGKIKSVKDNYTVMVNIPGMTDETSEGFEAQPLRGQIDEPLIGDTVLCLSLDPDQHQVWFYTKMKEDGFIGFRANGNYIEVNGESMVIGNADKAPENFQEFSPVNDGNSGYGSYIKFNDGAMEIYSSGKLKLTAETGSEITICNAGGSIKIDGGTIDLSNCDINLNSVNLTYNSGILKAGDSNTSVPSGGVFVNGASPYKGIGSNIVIIGG